jgi:dienelactone hydrolase
MIPPDDPAVFQSPSIVAPVPSCVDRVTVTRLIPGSILEAEVAPSAGGPWSSVNVNGSPSFSVQESTETVELTPFPRAGERLRVWASRDFGNGVNEAVSEAVTIQVPGGSLDLPIPQFSASSLPAYACQELVLVENIVPYSTLRILREATGPMDTSDGSLDEVVGEFDWRSGPGLTEFVNEFGLPVHVWSSVSPLAAGDRIYLTQELCGVESTRFQFVLGPNGERQIYREVEDPPASLGTPNLFGARGHDSTRSVRFSFEEGPSPHPGATIRASVDGTELSATAVYSGDPFQVVNLSAPTSEIAGSLVGRDISVRQTLCSGQAQRASSQSNVVTSLAPYPSRPVSVRDCDDLPVPKLYNVGAGLRQVQVFNHQHGARLRVIANGTEEIFDGVGPVLQLTRPIASGDRLLLIQEAEGCTTTEGYFVEVECHVPEVVSPMDDGRFRSSLPRSVAYQDFSGGTPVSADGASAVLKGRVYYPSETSGQGEPILPGRDWQLAVIAPLRAGRWTTPERDIGSFCKPDASECGGQCSVRVRAHLGYGELAEALVRRGFVVVALDLEVPWCDVITSRDEREWLRAENLAKALIRRAMSDAEQTSSSLGGILEGWADPTRVMLVGHSRGGLVAAKVAKDCYPACGGHGVASAILLAPAFESPQTGAVTDLEDMPLLSFIALQDGDVPNEHSTRYYDASGIVPVAGGVQVQVAIDGAVHSDFNSEMPDTAVVNGYPVLSQRSSTHSTWVRQLVAQLAVASAELHHLSDDFSEGTRARKLHDLRDVLTGWDHIDLDPAAGADVFRAGLFFSHRRNPSLEVLSDLLSLGPFAATSNLSYATALLEHRHEGEPRVGLMSGAGSANILTFNLSRAFTSDESVYFRLGVSEQEQATPPADIADVEVEFVSSSGTTGPLPVPAPNRMSRLYISDPTASSPSNSSIMSTIRLPARCFGATENSPLNTTSIRLHYNRNQDIIFDEWTAGDTP